MIDDRPPRLRSNVREQVAKKKGEQYKLLWKEDTDFVRLAMRFGCTIVPFAALGVDDAFDVAFDSDDILASPLGGVLRDAIQARASVVRFRCALPLCAFTSALSARCAGLRLRCSYNSVPVCCCVVARGCGAVRCRGGRRLVGRRRVLSARGGGG